MANMWKGRSYGRASRVGFDAEAAKQVTRIIEPRSVFYDPSAYTTDPSPGHHTAVGAGGKVILAVALGAIVGIGVIGTKMGVRWFD